MLTRLLCTLVVLSVMHVGAESSGQDSPQPESTQLRFTFSRTPWRAVLEWLAENADLALHVGDLPMGSFTYSDSRDYSPDEAINRINLFLIPQRYSLVRSGKLLSVINLDDQMSVRQLDAMAQLVDSSDLPGRGSHDLVKCLFPLRGIVADQALEELGSLMLIREPVILRNTNQLLIVDTVEKLRMVDRILASLAAPDPSDSMVKQFALDGLDAEQALAQIRPHVGLDPLAMTGADINLSVDIDRRQLLASGSVENVEAVGDVLRLMQTTETALVPQDELVFTSHQVGSADMQTVVSVLQTLLADQDVRMAADTKSNRIAVLANQSVHQTVIETIDQLAGIVDEDEFKAIPMSSFDARYAAVFLNEMFELAAGPAGGAPANAPVIHADPIFGQLLIRGTRSQVAEIEQALETFLQRQSDRKATTRLLPFHGDAADRILGTAKAMYPKLQVIAPATSDRPVEREVVPAGQDDTPVAPPRQPELPPKDDDAEPQSPRAPSVPQVVMHDQPDRHHLVATSTNSQRDDLGSAGSTSQIRIQQTPGGLLVHCDDPDSLESFSNLIDAIAGAGDHPSLAVFYLKHETVEEANALLRQLLDAENSSSYLVGYENGDGTQGGLPGWIDSVGLGPESLGNMWQMGTTTVIPDNRLNRLFVHGPPRDVSRIEEHLSTIDREDSIAEVKTHGVPRVIKLDHARAEDVAAVIRDAYAGRIAANAKERQQAAQAQAKREESRPRDGEKNEQPRNRRLTEAAPGSGEQPKLTLAVDAQSNSLVVTAPNKLAEEVEQLARNVDSQSVQSIEVIPIGGVDASRVHEALQSLFGLR